MAGFQVSTYGRFWVSTEDDPKSITGILAVPPASDVGIPFVEDDPKVRRSSVAWLRTTAEVDRDYLAWFGPRSA
jgi:hypothetical protein